MRRDLTQVSQQLLEEITALAVARDARHLFVHLDRFGLLPDQRECLREQAERVEILRVRLEADLQLGQRLEAVFASAALQVQLGGHPGIARVELEVQDALDHLERVVTPLEAQQQLCSGPKRLDRFVEALDAATRFRQAQMRQRVLRVEPDHLAEDFDRFAIATRTLQARRHFVVGGERVAGQAELGIDLGQLGHDVPVAIGQIRSVLLDQLADLLVDGDCLEREALRRVILANAIVGRDGLGVSREPRL